MLGQNIPYVLGIASGATKNAAAVKQLLTGLRDRGLPIDRKYLFIIDGAKAHLVDLVDHARRLSSAPQQQGVGRSQPVFHAPLRG